MKQLQIAAAQLCRKVFGEANYYSAFIRGQRFLEEAAELAQLYVTEEQAIRIVRLVYSRPLGEEKREFGGVMMTLLCLAENRGVNLTTAFTREAQRIAQKHERDPEHFKRRNEEKEVLLSRPPSCPHSHVYFDRAQAPNIWRCHACHEPMEPKP